MRGTTWLFGLVVAVGAGTAFSAVGCGGSSNSPTPAPAVDAGFDSGFDAAPAVDSGVDAPFVYQCVDSGVPNLGPAECIVTACQAQLTTCYADCSCQTAVAAAFASAIQSFSLTAITALSSSPQADIAAVGTCVTNNISCAIPATDGGAKDSGTPAVDAASDTGTPAVDAATDTGTPAVDAGTDADVSTDAATG